MQPPVEIRDRSEFKRKMNELLKIDPRKTVVLTVDMQNDYLDIKAATAPVAAEEAQRVISHTRKLLDFARAHGIPVIHVYVKRRPTEIERGGGFGAPLGEASERSRLSQNAQAEARRGPNRIDGTPQAEIPAELVAPGDVHVTSKRVSNSFHDTELGMLLSRVFKTETVIVTGINTDTCVYATTFGVANRGYQPVVISDCVASNRGVDHHWMALELMSRSLAWVLTVEELQAKVLAAA